MRSQTATGVQGVLRMRRGRPWDGAEEGRTCPRRIQRFLEPCLLLLLHKAVSERHRRRGKSYLAGTILDHTGLLR